MSSHSKGEHDDKTREELLQLVGDLESEATELKASLLYAESFAISDYSDADISDEFQARGLGADEDDVSALFEAFYLGKGEQAVEIAKRIACAHTGRVL